jgi:hypothetical protein
VTPPSFALKFARAQHHLQTLAHEVEWWVASEPYRIGEEVDPQTSFTTVYVEPFGNPPLELSLLVGDIVQNFRSGLDHLALALAEAYIGGRAMPRVEEDSQFPIYSTKKRWRKGRAMRIGCAHPRAKAKMQRLQPWRRWDEWERHPLWILRELSDFDKHRRLPQVGIYAYLGQTIVGQGGQFVYIGHLEIHGRGGHLESKTPLLTWGGIHDPTGQTEVNVEYQIALQVAFADAAPRLVVGRNVLDCLDEIRNYVAGEVVPNLQPFL